jgi:hypothetical protein
MVMPKTIDIDNEPELVRLISTLRNEWSSVHLRLDGKDVAIVTPVAMGSHDRPIRRIKTEEDLADFLSIAGGWADVDTDELIDEIYKQRLVKTRPPVDL